MHTRNEEQAIERAKQVRLMVFDVDGVLTDGALYMNDTGGELKAFHVRDGHGLKMLQENGVQVAILSARRSRTVELRAAELGIKIVELGATDKRAAFQRLLSRQQLAATAVGYMGDDLPDLPVLLQCGFAATVPDAPLAVRDRVHYITHAAGGRGAAREVCELIMQAQQTLQGALARQLA